MNFTFKEWIEILDTFVKHRGTDVLCISSWNNVILHSKFMNNIRYETFL